MHEKSQWEDQNLYYVIGVPVVGLCAIRWLCLVGECLIWNASGRWLQAQVFGFKSKKMLPIHYFQNWGSGSGGGETREPQRQLRWFSRLSSRWWVPLCCLWLWLHFDWECPQKQDFLHCLVMTIHLIIAHIVLETLFVRFQLVLTWLSAHKDVETSFIRCLAIKFRKSRVWRVNSLALETLIPSSFLFTCTFELYLF